MFCYCQIESCKFLFPTLAGQHQPNTGQFFDLRFKRIKDAVVFVVRPIRERSHATQHQVIQQQGFELLLVSMRSR